MVHLYNRCRHAAFCDRIECSLPGPVYTVSSSLQHSSGAVALHDDVGGGDGGSLSTTRPSGSLPGSGKVPSKDPLPYKEFFSYDKLDLKQWPAFQTAYGLQHSYLDNTQLSCLGARENMSEYRTKVRS